jgi:hypothetical protein
MHGTYRTHREIEEHDEVLVNNLKSVIKIGLELRLH